MVLAGRRPRTVLGCLVGRVCPCGRGGLAPPWWLPRGLAGPAVLGGAGGRGCSGGSSPAAGPLAAAGHACPSPRPVAERTPADHHRGRVVAAGGDRGNSFPQRAEPVLSPHREVYAGSTATTKSPAFVAIWISRSRNRPVGRPATRAR